MFVWRNVNTTLILLFVSLAALILSQYFWQRIRKVYLAWWSDRPTDPLPWQKTRIFIDNERETTDHRQFRLEPSSLNQAMLNFMSGPTLWSCLVETLTTGTQTWTYNIFTNTHMYTCTTTTWVWDPRGPDGSTWSFIYCNINSALNFTTI